MRITRLALRCIEYPAPDWMVAEALGVAAGTFSLLQQGKRPVSPGRALRLSEIFHCRPSDVLGWADDSELYILDNGEVDACLTE